MWEKFGSLFVLPPGNAKNFPFAVVNICRIWYITSEVIVEWNFLTNISSLTQNIVHRFRVLPCHSDGWNSANPAGLWNPVENLGKEKSLAIFKWAEFEQSGLQKYEQPTKVFCLIETWEEYFSEIKSSSNLKKFYLLERRDVISQIYFTSTRLHKGNQRNLVAFFTSGQAIGADRTEIGASQSEDCRGVEVRSTPKPGNTEQ